MAGNVTLPFVINNLPAGNNPASTLDSNYTALANAINSTSSMANSYTDTGSTNALVVTVPPPQIWVAGPGQQLTVFVGNTNTGPATITVNGGAPATITNINGSALAAAQLVAGGTAILQFINATLAQLITPAAGSFASGTFTGTLTGIGAGGSPTGTFNYSINGNEVLVDCQFTPSGTSNSVAATITGVPNILNPVRPQTVVAWVTNNGVSVIGTFNIGVSNVWTLYPGAPGTAFTASGTKGMVSGTVLAYNLT